MPSSNYPMPIIPVQDEQYDLFRMKKEVAKDPLFDDVVNESETSTDEEETHVNQEPDPLRLTNEQKQKGREVDAAETRSSESVGVVRKAPLAAANQPQRSSPLSLSPMTTATSSQNRSDPENQKPPQHSRSSEKRKRNRERDPQEAVKRRSAQGFRDIREQVHMECLMAHTTDSLPLLPISAVPLLPLPVFVVPTQELSTPEEPPLYEHKKVEAHQISKWSSLAHWDRLPQKQAVYDPMYTSLSDWNRFPQQQHQSMSMPKHVVHVGTSAVIDKVKKCAGDKKKATGTSSPKNLYAIDYLKTHPGITVAQFDKVFSSLDTDTRKKYEDRSTLAKSKKPKKKKAAFGSSA